MIVDLTKDEIRVCSLIALERWLLKTNSTDAPNYALGKTEGRLEHELLANIRANVIEYAAAKLYALPWTFPWYPSDQHPARKDHPDVGTKVEVRSIRTANGIPVWQKDVDKQAIIVGGKTLNDNYTQVEIYGSLPAIQAVRQDWYDTKYQCWRIPLTALHPPTDKRS